MIIPYLDSFTSRKMLCVTEYTGTVALMMHGKCNVLARKLTLAENKFLDMSGLNSSFVHMKKE